MIDIIVLALVLGYCVFIIVRHYREAKLAARMGKIMSCAGCTACSCAECGSRQRERAWAIQQVRCFISSS